MAALTQRGQTIAILEPATLHKQILIIKFISTGSYFPEGHDFGTLIMSNKVFRLIICNSLTRPPLTIPYLENLDFVPQRNLVRIEIEKKILKLNIIITSNTKTIY